MKSSQTLRIAWKVRFGRFGSKSTKKGLVSEFLTEIPSLHPNLKIHAIPRMSGNSPKSNNNQRLVLKYDSLLKWIFQLCKLPIYSIQTDAECSPISVSPYYRCASCPLGFKMNSNRTFCEDIDEVILSRRKCIWKMNHANILKRFSIGKF